MESAAIDETAQNFVPGRARETVDASADPAAPALGWRLLGRLEKAAAIGVRAGDGSVRVRRRERPGCLLFGPFWRLPGGPYRLSFRCRAGTPRLAAQPVLGVEVIALNRNQQGWRDFTQSELAGEATTLDFLVPPVLSLEAGEEARFEFRFFHLGNADLAIVAVDLRPLDEEDKVMPQLPSWRLLGRLAAGPLARREPDGAVVAPTRWRAGILAQGGWPYLRLAEGRYRLTLGGRAGTPRLGDAPVVAVEISGNSRWRRPPLWRRAEWRAARARDLVPVAAGDFTACELDQGAASLEFEVPLRIAIEGGEDAPFEFSVQTLGNAALRIAAVDLCRLDDEAPAPPPRRWRLLGRLRRARGGRLCGLRPALFLPPGRYRLALAGRAAGMAEPQVPALAVAIAVDGRNVAQRAFAVSDFAAGPASLDFAIPAEGGSALAVRCGVDLRLASPGFTITDVTLNEVNEVPGGADTAAARPRAARRRNVIVVGNCQAETVRQGFERAASLNTRFKARFHFVGLQKNLHEAARRELAECDLLLVQDIKDWDSYPLRADIPDGIETIRFPLLHFASLWPFDHYNGPGDTEAYEREWPNLTFLYQDGLLARLRREIPDPEARFRAYRALDSGGIVNYVRLHDFERRRLLAMDRRFGCMLGQFVLDTFQTRQLFYTTNHPNRQLLSMLMEHLMRQLGIDAAFPTIAALDHLKRLQVPVHPKVASALGVAWADESTSYQYEGATMTWESYVRRYIEHYG